MSSVMPQKNTSSSQDCFYSYFLSADKENVLNNQDLL